jgi:hypothetical protein
MSSARPGGAVHVRPWRPRPARCSPALHATTFADVPEGGLLLYEDGFRSPAGR